MATNEFLVSIFVYFGQSCFSMDTDLPEVRLRLPRRANGHKACVGVSISVKPCLPSFTHPPAHRTSFHSDPKQMFGFWGERWEVEVLRLSPGTLICYSCPSIGLSTVYLWVTPWTIWRLTTPSTVLIFFLYVHNLYFMSVFFELCHINSLPC